MMDHSSLNELLYEGKQFLGRYSLTHKIGAGGFGQVWHATDATLGRGVAIKFLLTSAGAQAHTSPSALAKQAAARKQRFVIEARIIANLKSDYAVKVYDSGESEGLSYMVMEHIEGVNLYEYLRRYRRLSSFETLLVLEQLLDVLGEAHKAGVLHRDIKPNNIMVLRTEGQIRVKLLDFGISKLTESARLASQHDMMNLTQDGGGIPGTPAYMAPEQLESDEELTASADLFSLGLVAVEMITGDAVRQHSREVYSQRDIPLGAYGLPPFMLALLTKMVQRDPSKRYQSAAQVREDIHALKEKHDLKEQDKKDARPLWEPEGMAPPLREFEQPTPRLLNAYQAAAVLPDPRLSPLDIQGMEQTEIVLKGQKTPSRNFQSIVPGALLAEELHHRKSLLTEPATPVRSMRLVVRALVFFVVGAALVALVHTWVNRPRSMSATPSADVLASLEAGAVAKAQPAPVSSVDTPRGVTAASVHVQGAVSKAVFALEAVSTSPPPVSKVSATKRPVQKDAPKGLESKEEKNPASTKSSEQEQPKEVAGATTKPAEKPAEKPAAVVAAPAHQPEIKSEEKPKRKVRLPIKPEGFLFEK